MPKHKARKKVSPGPMPQSRPRFIIVCLIFSLLATGGILANRESIWPSAVQKGQEPPAPASLSPESPSKEYVYVSGRLVATEEPEGTTSCSFSISPTSQSFAAAGGTGNVSVSANLSTCAWTAASNAFWISITAGASGTGNGTVNYSVASNTVTSPRTGTMTIAGQTFTVTQEAATGSCAYSISPTSQSFGSGGGTGNVTVTANPSTCVWTAVSNAGWISITSGASGTGNGSVGFSVAVNTITSPRTGTMTIAGQTFTVTQEAATGSCTYSISPTSQSFGSGGGTGNVTVSTQPGCSWTAVSNAGWIIIASGASGTGSGSVDYSVVSNPLTSPRTGTMTIAGHTFTVTQSGASSCTYSINPASQSFPAAGGTGSVDVMAPSGCSWTVTDVPSFVTITSGGSGTGNGTVQYSVSVNTKMTPRNAVFIIAGQGFTINQAGCSVALSPTSQSFTASGGNGNVTVTTTSGCPWTAVSNDPWITITSGSSGSGNGTVGYAVGVNLMMAPRTGTLTIGEQTFTVTQEAGAGGCTFSISPTSNTLPKTGGIGMVSVMADGGCSWTAVSNAGWIVILSGSSGAGNGSVTYAAGFNPGAPRTGTLTIAGQTFTVNQQ